MFFRFRLFFYFFYLFGFFYSSRFRLVFLSSDREDGKDDKEEDKEEEEKKEIDEGDSKSRRRFRESSFKKNRLRSRLRLYRR